MKTLHTGPEGGHERTEALRDARTALRSAWYDTVLALTDGCEDWAPAEAEAGVALRGEVLLRRDPVAALTYLTAVADVPASDAGRFAYEIVCGKAFAKVRDFDSALARIAVAATLAARVADGAAQVALQRTRIAYMRREYDPRSADATLALTLADPSLAASAYIARSWHFAALGDYRAQISDLTTALGYAAKPLPTEPVDTATLGMACFSLARVAFETAHQAGAETAQRAYDLLPWTDDVAADRFQAIRALAWNAFMRGDSGGAQWMLKEARSVAPSDAYRVGAHLDRSYIARIAGNEAWALEELSEADRLAHGVTWESTFGEERLVLSTLAVLNAPTDVARAQRWAAYLARIGVEGINPTSAASNDRRTIGFAKYAQGRIDQMLGRREPAAAALREAYSTFDAIGHHYRAALAAIALADLTGEGLWRERALGHTQAYPDCPMMRMADRSGTTEEGMPPQLSPLQRQIARALFAGGDPAGMSKRFSRSRYTIDRQVEAVLDAFGVTGRTALVEEARKRGLV